MSVIPSPQHWDRISELFHRTVDLAPAERKRQLIAECADDAALRAEVESLVQADGRVGPLTRDFQLRRPLRAIRLALCALAILDTDPNADAADRAILERYLAELLR